MVSSLRFQFFLNLYCYAEFAETVRRKNKPPKDEDDSEDDDDSDSESDDGGGGGGGGGAVEDAMDTDNSGGGMAGMDIGEGGRLLLAYTRPRVYASSVVKPQYHHCSDHFTCRRLNLINVNTGLSAWSVLRTLWSTYSNNMTSKFISTYSKDVLRNRPGTKPLKRPR
jgi:hypothetical protein